MSAPAPGSTPMMMPTPMPRMKLTQYFRQIGPVAGEDVAEFLLQDRAC